MSKQLRFSLVMTRAMALATGVDSLERAAANWLTAAASANPNFVTKHDKEKMYENSLKCKEAAKILREMMDDKEIPYEKVEPYLASNRNTEAGKGNTLPSGERS